MSIIFGIRKPTGLLVSEQEIRHLARATGSYATDGLIVHVAGGIGMGLQPFHTHVRSKLEAMEITHCFGNMVVIDGRIDNYRELSRELDLDESNTSDSRLVLSAYHRWNADCFSHLIGDWAIALWSPREESLYLARDHAGTRTLYFENKEGTLLWSTYLETFFAAHGGTDLDENYTACYLAAQPVGDLTPYKGIRAVAPAHYVTAKIDSLTSTPHWDWMRRKAIHYKAESDYEEHFLSLFRQAVERRDTPETPIVAQLSGGRDSSAIVGVSDFNRRSHNQNSELIDTVSFYDDSEPSSNDEPYFAIMEARRGKVGIHVRMSAKDRSFEPYDSAQGLYLLPGADSSTVDREKVIDSLFADRGYRIMLSGIGGDELLGGVPNPNPELADYLIAGNIRLLLRQSFEWCLTERSPLVHQIFEAAKYAVALYREPPIDRDAIPPWLGERLQSACVTSIFNGSPGSRRIGLSPSAITGGLAWWSIMETLPHLFPSSCKRLEYRYPFLDKQLVEYLLSIPRAQLLRPGRSRSLMRRALKGIVPEEILERRRKAYAVRGPLYALRQSRDRIDCLFANSLLGTKGFIKNEELQAALDVTDRGADIRWWGPLTRAIAFEIWLQTDARRSAPSIQSTATTPALVRWSNQDPGVQVDL